MLLKAIKNQAILTRHISRVLVAFNIAVVLSGIGMTQNALASVSIAPESIETLVRAHVEAAMELWTEDSPRASVQVDIINLPRQGQTFENAETESDIETEVHSSLERNYSSRALVRVRMKDQTGRQRDFGVPVKLTVTSPVYVVKNNVVAGVPLRKGDFKLENRDVTYELKHVAGQHFPLDKYEARVNLKSGDVLDTRRIITPPDVRRNGDVQIMMTTPNDVQIAVRGEALSDGQIGQIIRVRHRIGNQRPKYFMGKVVSKNRVQVEM